MAVPEPGDRFPPIHLQEADGRPASLPDGERLYAFFKTSCPTSELAWPFLERIDRIARGGALSLVGVSQDDPEETSRFNQRTGARLRTVFDARPWRASESLSLTNVPAFFLVGGDGRIRESVIGFQKAKMEELARRAATLAGAPYQGLFHPHEDVPAIRPG